MQQGRVRLTRRPPAILRPGGHHQIKVTLHTSGFFFPSPPFPRTSSNPTFSTDIILPHFPPNLACQVSKYRHFLASFLQRNNSSSNDPHPSTHAAFLSFAAYYCRSGSLLRLLPPRRAFCYIILRKRRHTGRVQQFLLTEGTGRFLILSPTLTSRPPGSCRNLIPTDNRTSPAGPPQS